MEGETGKIIGEALLEGVFSGFITIFIKTWYLWVFLVAIWFLKVFVLPKVIGKMGEKSVSKELNKVPSIEVFNNIVFPDQKWNIDHVIISQNGVFVLETKTYKNPIYVSGDKWYMVMGNKKIEIKNISKQVKGNSFAMSEYLEQKLGKKYWVTPIIALTAPKTDYKYFVDTGVQVLKTDDLYNFFTNLESNNNLTDEELSKIREVLGMVSK